MLGSESETFRSRAGGRDLSVSTTEPSLLPIYKGNGLSNIHLRTKVPGEIKKSRDQEEEGGAGPSS